jgi:hypothetical protein
MDALDGEDVLAGPEWGWHYGSKYVYEVAKRLERPAVMEMSTFHHHLWCVRSRMGAWDHPTRSHKRFIDIHCAANADLRRRFLPGQLGWWAVKTWSGAQGEPTFADDIEYLCAKALGNDTGLSLMGIDPRTIVEVPACERLARIFRDYEGLRRGPPLPDALKARLREPGKEFALVEEPGGKVGGRWNLRPVRHERHRVEGPEDWASAWTVENPFAAQPAALRIEALFSAGPAGGAESRVVLDFEKPEAFVSRGAADGVELRLEVGSEPSRPEELVPAGRHGILTATSRRFERRGSWAGIAREFSPPLDLGRTQAIGVWVRGDGKGEVLNLQLACPEHVVAGLGEHYVVIDFSGWRWLELIEPEGERFERYAWPYGNPYAIYRESIDFAQVKSIALWLNDIPPGQTVTVAVGQVEALPLVSAVIRNPTIEVGGKTVRFPVEIETGSYLELRPPAECRVYGPTGALLREVRPEGEVPLLGSGENRLRFRCDGPPGIRPRARVTVSAIGEALEP